VILSTRDILLVVAGALAGGVIGARAITPSCGADHEMLERDNTELEQQVHSLIRSNKTLRAELNDVRKRLEIEAVRNAELSDAQRVEELKAPYSFRKGDKMEDVDELGCRQVTEEEYLEHPDGLEFRYYIREGVLIDENGDEVTALEDILGKQLETVACPVNGSTDIYVHNTWKDLYCACAVTDAPFESQED
jgi:hypothetical protein